MTTPQQHWENLIGLTAVDSNGQKVGKVSQVYLDDTAGQAAWVTVSTGLFGRRDSFAPLYRGVVQGSDLHLAVPKELIKDAPNVEDDGHLSDSEVSTLFTHYAGYLDPAGGYARPPAGGEGQAAAGDLGGPGYDVSGPATGDAMTRSEERLHVGTEAVPAGRARLRKHVVTENVTTTVPVSHEEVRIEREPVTDANRGAALDGPAISEEEHEVTLHAERPVVAKEAVPVERVRLTTETVTEQQEVTEQVRKEQIAEPVVDTDLPGSRR
jgi:uncharacterized protein (TIGR02271 family)